MTQNHNLSLCVAQSTTDAHFMKKQPKLSNMGLKAGQKLSDRLGHRQCLTKRILPMTAWYPIHYASTFLFLNAMYSTE